MDSILLFTVKGFENLTRMHGQIKELKCGGDEIEGTTDRLCVRVGEMNARRIRPCLQATQIMSSSKLHTLYKQLVRAFTSQPSDLKTSGRLLAELKVRSVSYALGLTDAC